MGTKYFFLEEFADPVQVLLAQIYSNTDYSLTA